MAVFSIYESSLIYFLQSEIGFIRNNSKVRFTKIDDRRVDKPDYTERAVTECLINAFIHRDYLILGGEIYMDMYDDILEVISPGGMYNMSINLIYL